MALLSVGYVFALYNGLNNTENTHTRADTVVLTMLFVPAILNAWFSLQYNIHKDKKNKTLGLVCISILLISSVTVLIGLGFLEYAYGIKIKHSDRIQDYVFFLPIPYCFFFLVITLLRKLIK